MWTCAPLFSFFLWFYNYNSLLCFRTKEFYYVARDSKFGATFYKLLLQKLYFLYTLALSESYNPLNKVPGVKLKGSNRNKVKFSKHLLKSFCDYELHKQL